MKVANDPYAIFRIHGSTTQALRLLGRVSARAETAESKGDSDRSRIAELELQLADLKRRVAQLEGVGG